MGRELKLYPDTVLEQPCEPVEDPTAHEGLIRDMREVLYEREGVGLAAPQVGTSLQIFLLRLDVEERLDEVYMNPSILSVEDDRPVEEGCLSFPNITVEFERGNRVEFRALTPSGSEVERTVTGLQAQCVQHEVEHLEGKTLLDRCSLPQKTAINDALQTLRAGGIPEPTRDPALRSQS